LWLERRFARQKHQDEHDRDLILAWQIMRVNVQTNNTKRLPSLRTLLDRGQPEGPAGQRAALQQLSARLGIPIQRRPRAQ